MSDQAFSTNEFVVNDVVLRHRCAGVVPLTARLEPWMESVASNPSLHDWVTRWGSPLNLVHTPPLQRNLEALHKAADDCQIDFQVFFARKANKCLAFVDTVKQLDAGIDVASECELVQALERGISPNKLIYTAAIKNRQLLTLCVDQKVTISIDNADEIDAVRGVTQELGCRTNVALRISGFQHQSEALKSRFGIDIGQAFAFASEHCPDPEDHSIRLTGIHFHLDSYSHQQRVSVIEQSLHLVESLRRCGHSIEFLDIGGGFPMNYVTCSDQWSQ